MLRARRPALDALLIANLSVRARARAFSFLPLPLAHPHFAGLSRRSIFREGQRARARPVRLERIATLERARPRNPVGKLIRSDNPEEFDVGTLALRVCPPIPRS